MDKFERAHEQPWEKAERLEREREAEEDKAEAKFEAEGNASAACNLSIREEFEKQFPLAKWDEEAGGYTESMYSYAFIGFEYAIASLQPEIEELRAWKKKMQSGSQLVADNERLERKLAEQQAAFKLLAELVRGTPLDLSVDGMTELDKLLAAEREACATWYSEKGWLLDEDEVADAMRNRVSDN